MILLLLLLRLLLRLHDDHHHKKNDGIRRFLTENRKKKQRRSGFSATIWLLLKSYTNATATELVTNNVIEFARGFYFESTCLFVLYSLVHVAVGCSVPSQLCWRSVLVRSADEKLENSLKMSATKEQTFIMIKPDGVQRGLVGKIIQRFEERGLKLVGMKMVWPTEDLLKQHYADLSARPFFPGLVKYMSSGPVVPMVWEGLNAVKTGRVMLGETNPQDSAPGTIRGDYCLQVGRNIIHGSDSVDSAKKEIKLWFNVEKKEVIDWTSWAEKWIYE